jgi:hypothetical protein
MSAEQAGITGKVKSYTLLDLELFVADIKSRMVSVEENGICNTHLFLDASEHDDLEALHRLMLLLVNRKAKINQVLRGKAD